MLQGWSLSPAWWHHIGMDPFENLNSNKTISNEKKICFINGKLANTKYLSECMSTMKLPGGDMLAGFLMHLHDYIKDHDNTGASQSWCNANTVETEHQTFNATTVPDSDPWTSTYQRCMFIGTKATNCIIPQTTFKILWEIAPEAIKKFIAARNALYPRGPPSGNKNKHCHKDHNPNQGSEKDDKDKDKLTNIPKQYEDTDDQTSCQTSPEATNNEEESNATYKNGKESKDDNKKKFTELIHMIGMAKPYGWDKRNIMNTITVRAHLEYKDWFIGTLEVNVPITSFWTAEPILT